MIEFGGFMGQLQIIASHCGKTLGFLDPGGLGGEAERFSGVF